MEGAARPSASRRLQDGSIGSRRGAAAAPRRERLSSGALASVARDGRATARHAAQRSSTKAGRRWRGLWLVAGGGVWLPIAPDYAQSCAVTAAAGG